MAVVSVFWPFVFVLSLYVCFHGFYYFHWKKWNPLVKLKGNNSCRTQRGLLLPYLFAHILIKWVFFHAVFLSSEVPDAALCFSGGGRSQGKLAHFGIL